MWWFIIIGLFILTCIGENHQRQIDSIKADNEDTLNDFKEWDGYEDE